MGLLCPGHADTAFNVQTALQPVEGAAVAESVSVLYSWFFALFRGFPIPKQTSQQQTGTFPKTGKIRRNPARRVPLRASDLCLWQLMSRFTPK